MAKPPPPRRTTTWVVTVYSEPAEGRDWSLNELGDLADRYGYDSNEYLDAAGPTDGHRSHVTYGPYSERQAHGVVDLIRKREPTSVAIASPLLRYIPPTQSAVAS
jgi:hypothetical protein